MPRPAAPRAAMKPAARAASSSSSSAAIGRKPTAPTRRDPSPDKRYLAEVFEPQNPMTMSSWDVQSIRAARDGHARGEFDRSALLADQMLVDGRIFAGLSRRIGPALGIPIDVEPPRRWNGKGQSSRVKTDVEALFGRSSPACSPGFRVACYSAAAVMGFALWQNVWTPSADSSELELEMRPWPAQQTRWNEAKRRYQATTTEGIVDVEPGDGKWGLIEPWGPRSYMYGAIRPLALLWADRAFAQRDRSNHSAAHGSISIIGTLPEGIKPNSQEGRAFMAMLRLLQQARSGLVKPHGSSVDTLEPKTLAWQIFTQLVNSANGDIELILCGIGGDGAYKSIPQIDGVRYDLVTLDTGASTTAFLEHAVRPFVLFNYGDEEDLQPGLHALVPDPREQARQRALAEQHKTFAEVLAGYRVGGIELTPELVLRLAELFGLGDLGPMLKVDPKAPAPTKAPKASAKSPDADQEHDAEEDDELDPDREKDAEDDAGGK